MESQHRRDTNVMIYIRRYVKIPKNRNYDSLIFDQLHDLHPQEARNVRAEAGQAQGGGQGIFI